MVIMGAAMFRTGMLATHIEKEKNARLIMRHIAKYKIPILTSKTNPVFQIERYSADFILSPVERMLFLKDLFLKRQFYSPKTFFML